MLSREFFRLHCRKDQKGSWFPTPSPAERLPLKTRLPLIPSRTLVWDTDSNFPSTLRMGLDGGRCQHEELETVS